MARIRNVAAAVAGVVLLSAAHSSPLAQAPPDPCAAPTDAIAGQGLFPVEGGRLVYDTRVGVCWLADANLAGSPEIRATLAVPGISPDGTMDYPTAVAWVAALNHMNGGSGFMGHTNWQLPATPRVDDTCSSQHDGGDFGIGCTRSALANLYNLGLGRPYPDSVVPSFFSVVWPFFELQPGLYWTTTSDTTDSGEGGQSTFSFNTGLKGANTTKYNFFHVLPMTTDRLGGIPSGATGVVPYIGGPGAGRAVFDTVNGVSWLLDANLAAHVRFGVTGTTDITSDVNGQTVTVPLIDRDGAMLYAAADPSAPDGWIAGLNASNYAGSHTWTLPAIDDLRHLYNHMWIQPGDLRLESWRFVGPFWRLQPGFYWSCERDPGPDLNAPCDPLLNPGTAHGTNDTPMYWSFDLDDGFQGTDKEDKQFYVMIYFPAPGR